MASDTFFPFARNNAVEEACEAVIDVIQSMLVASRIRTPYNAATVCKKKRRERDPHAYLLRLVEAALIVKGEEGAVPVITERKEMQCSFSRKNCKR